MVHLTRRYDESTCSTGAAAEAGREGVEAHAQAGCAASEPQDS